MKVPIGAVIAVTCIALIAMICLFLQDTHGVPFHRNVEYEVYIETKNGIEKGTIYFDEDEAVEITPQGTNDFVRVRILKRKKENGK